MSYSKRYRFIFLIVFHNNSASLKFFRLHFDPIQSLSFRIRTVNQFAFLSNESSFLLRSAEHKMKPIKLKGTNLELNECCCKRFVHKYLHGSRFKSSSNLRYFTLRVYIFTVRRLFLLRLWNVGDANESLIALLKSLFFTFALGRICYFRKMKFQINPLFDAGHNKN